MPSQALQPIRSARLRTVSASQVEAYRRCPRKWYYPYVLGEREPERRANRLGDAVHSSIQHYLLHGEVRPSEEFPEVLEIVQAAIEHLPPPRASGLLVEQAADMATYPDGPAWAGYIDLVEGERSPIRVTDHKTRSDFRYAKTPAELRRDTQLSSYAQWVFLNSDDAQIEVGHLNLRTRGRAKAMPRYVSLTRAEADGLWQSTLKTVREMQAWAELHPASAQVLPPNPDACSDYGGCFYRDKCGLAPQGRLFAMNAVIGKQDILQKLRAMKEAGGDAPATQQISADAAAPVLPPDAPPRTTTGDEVAAAELVASGKRPRIKRAAAGTQTAPSQPATTASSSQAPPTSGPPAAAAPAVPSPTPAPAVVAPSAPPTASAPEAPVPAAFECPVEEIYVDCWPTKGALATPMLAEDILAPIAQMAALSAQQPDYRLIDYKSKAYLAMALRVSLASVPKVVVVSSATPGADVLLETLIPFAKRVVRATR